ncbi:MAG: DUF1553 domain-containing protein [Bryobacteraceae bacterium]
MRFAASLVLAPALLAQNAVSLRLLPEKAVLSGKGAAQQYLVMARDSAGRERDVTAQATISAAAPGVVSIGQNALATAAADGQTAITASLDGKRASASIRVEHAADSRPFSFARDMSEILTRRGCNSRGCHGGVKGQGGFKLSGDGIHPHDDYRWIVEGGRFQVLSAEAAGEKKSRIAKADPEKSLLLQKAVMSVPHGGGRRFTKDSADYAAILAWIRDGAPYGEEAAANSPKLASLDVAPGDVVLSPNEKQRIIVTARYSDGRTEDFTHKVLYVTNDKEIAKVSAAGEIETLRPGETAILIKAAGRSARIGVGVIAAPVANYPTVARNNFVDEEIFAKLRRFNIVPSGLSADGEFLRRVSLDIAGRLPPPERVREFVASKDPAKRAKVIDALLDSPEYVDYWTFRLADLFRVSIFPVGINPKWTQDYYEWIRDAVEKDRGFDEIARERIAAQGYSPASRHYLPYLVIPPPENMMGEEVRVFMGRRLDCAQCHDHPYESWTQDQFWGMTAFFGPMFKLGGNPSSVVFDFPEGKEVAADVPGPTELRVVHPRTKKPVEPAFLDGAVYPFEKTEFPRRELARRVTEHPYFAEAAANRIWSHFFGRGLVNPVDDFRSTNPPTHPQLLAKLAEEFRHGGHRFKPLIRAIANSRAYQLSNQTNDTNAADKINYSHALPRALDAEILLDAIADTTGVRERFQVGMNRGEWRGGKTPAGARAVELKEGDIYATPFFDAYGRPNRFSVPERDTTPKLAQALHMLAGTTYNERLWGKGSRVFDLFQGGATDAQIIDTMFLTAFARRPSAGESAELAKLIAASPSREQGLQDFVWALISSREFAENH